MSSATLMTRSLFVVSALLMGVGLVVMAGFEPLLNAPLFGLGAGLATAVAFLHKRRPRVGTLSLSLGFALTVSGFTLPLAVGVFLVPDARPIAAAAWVLVLLTGLIANRFSGGARRLQLLSYVAAAALVVCVLSSATDLSQSLVLVAEGAIVGLLISAALAVLWRLLAGRAHAEAR